MTGTGIGSFLSAASPWIAALFSGGFALWSGIKANSNSREIVRIKGGLDRELEMLKAKLSHGQIVSTTQWSAEFTSYQAIWKGMVAVRTLAAKMVLREEELTELGLPDGYFESPGRVEIKKDLTQKFAKASQSLLLAVHENAPFYPSPIREAANDTHIAAKSLLDRHLTAMTEFLKGVDVTREERFIAESKTVLRSIVEGVDRVESLIRDRLASVEVVNGFRA